MKNLVKTSLTFVGALLLACFVSVGSARAQVTSADLLVGGTVVGHVDAFLLDGFLYMDIYTEGTYTIDSTRTAVGWTLGDIPTDSRGNPVVSGFPFVETGGEGVQDIFTVIPLDTDACDIPLVVATQVIVRDAGGKCGKPKPVWAGSLPFPCVADDDSDGSCRDSDRDRRRSDCRDRDDRDNRERGKNGRSDYQDRDNDRHDCRDRENDRKDCRERDQGREQCRSRDHDRKDCDGRDGHHRDYGDREEEEEDDDSDSCGHATYLLVGCLFSDSDGGPVF